MSDYIRSLRARIGHDLLEVPAVSVIVIDDRSRVLLVRHVEGNDWTTPGGMVEPCETPSDAAVRETWEETGLHVELTRVLGVFGGPIRSTTYANGDRVAWVSTVFAARPLSGTLAHDGEETLEVRYAAREEIAQLTCKAHVHEYLEVAFARREQAFFQPPTWRPPRS